MQSLWGKKNIKHWSRMACIGNAVALPQICDQHFAVRTQIVVNNTIKQISILNGKKIMTVELKKIGNTYIEKLLLHFAKD